jgi:hypothetical protein
MASPTASSASMPFPHPVLTTIIGEPTVLTIRKLRREIYANAAAVHSPRGGGNNGHLALVMAPTAYLARAAVLYDDPVHPGPSPTHADGSTAPQITEINRQFAQDQFDHRLHTTVSQELRKQIIAAVESKYFAALYDGDFGLADVTALALLQHLNDTYAIIAPDDIERNRQQLSAIINTDDPLEDLWLRINTCKEYADIAGEAITDSTIIRLTLEVFDKTGVYDHACLAWREKATVDQTMDKYKIHFTAANKERKRKLTAQAAGFHGANAATTNNTQPRATVITPPPTGTVAVGTVKMSYCWTHGLTTNCDHNSGTCTSKRDGHVANATVLNMQGGNNRIYTPRPREPLDGITK